MRVNLLYLVILSVIGSIIVVPIVFNNAQTYTFIRQGQSNLNVTLVTGRIFLSGNLYSLVSAIVYRPTFYPPGSTNPYLIYTLYNPYLTSQAGSLTIANFLAPSLSISDEFMNSPSIGSALPQLPNLYYGDINYITNTFFTGGYIADGINSNPDQPYFITMAGLYNNISPSSSYLFGNNISFSYACMQNINYCNSNAGTTAFSFWSILDSLIHLFFGGVQSSAQQPPYTYPFLLTTAVQFGVQPNNVNGLLYNINFGSSPSMETQYLFSSPYTQAGDALGFNAALAIQRPIVSLWAPSGNLYGFQVSVPLGVDNLGLYQLQQNTPLYNSINWQLTQQVLQSFGLSLTTYANIPILFSPIEVNDTLLGLYEPTYEITTCQAGATPSDITPTGGPQCTSQIYPNQANTMMGGFLSLLKYIPSSGYTANWRTQDTVAFPYVIPLLTHTSVEFEGQQLPGVISPLGLNATLYMPVLIFGNNQVTILGTSLIGYDPYYNTPLVTFIQNGTVTGSFAGVPTYGGTYYGFGGVAWVTGPGAGCNNISISTPVQPLSPYAQVYYLSASGTLSTNNQITQPYTISLFIWDPANSVGYLVNISDLTFYEQPNTQCMSLNSANINVKTYNLAPIGGVQYEPYTYVDTEFAQNGYIIFYRDLYYNGQPNVVQIYVLDLNTGQIYTFTQNIPILSYNTLSIPSIEGQTGSILSLQSGYNLYQFKPEIFFGSLSSQASLPVNYAFSYSFAEVPITIYYNASTSASNVLVQVNITNPQILSAIATPSAKDVRVFTTNTYGSNYYQYPGLTYAIQSYIPGQLLSLLILMPTINPGNNTIYIYMGYPFAQSVAVPANQLLSLYPLAQT